MMGVIKKKIELIFGLRLPMTDLGSACKVQESMARPTVSSFQRSIIFSERFCGSGGNIVPCSNCILRCVVGP